MTTSAISTTTIDPKQECHSFDYSPCACNISTHGYGQQVYCYSDARLLEVHRALERSNEPHISVLDLQLSPYGNIIPASFFTGKIIDSDVA